MKNKQINWNMDHNLLFVYNSHAIGSYFPRFQAEHIKIVIEMFLLTFSSKLGEFCDTHVSCYPNAGLPNAFGGYDDTPEQMAEILQVQLFYYKTRFIDFSVK
jgi:hypothetical protein